jgi:hypothetical protein
MKDSGRGHAVASKTQDTAESTTQNCCEKGGIVEAKLSQRCETECAGTIFQMFVCSTQYNRLKVKKLQD